MSVLYNGRGELRRNPIFDLMGGRKAFWGAVAVTLETIAFYWAAGRMGGDPAALASIFKFYAGAVAGSLGLTKWSIAWEDKGTTAVTSVFQKIDDRFKDDER